MQPRADTPLGAAEKRRSKRAAQLDPKRRAALGQYFTPAATARFIAALLVDLPTERPLRVLDAALATARFPLPRLSDSCLCPTLIGRMEADWRDGAVAGRVLITQRSRASGSPCL